MQKVASYNANALYLWALSQLMPIGLFTTWNPGRDSLQPSKSWRAGDEWLAWVGCSLTNFHTRLDEGQKRIEYKQLSVDGYDADTKTVYEFHGCY